MSILIEKLPRPPCAKRPDHPLWMQGNGGRSEPETDSRRHVSPGCVETEGSVRLINELAATQGTDYDSARDALTEYCPSHAHLTHTPFSNGHEVDGDVIFQVRHSTQRPPLTSRRARRGPVDGRALVLVQPATVGRWHREGFRGCWRRSRRRPGRPRIDAQLRSLIGRMPGELSLGRSAHPRRVAEARFTVSERTVSRYMPDRRKAPSQSWRTFLANEFGQLAFASTVTSSDAAGVHDVADARVCRFVPLSLHSTGGRSHCRAVDTRRLASLASPPSSWPASCPGSRAPPHNPRPIAMTAEVVRRRSWAERVRMGLPSLPETPSRTTSSRAA